MKDFQKLATRSQADGHLQQKLKQLLKLSKEKWDAACSHSTTAVQVCLFIRLLFPCLDFCKLRGAASDCTSVKSAAEAEAAAQVRCCVFASHVRPGEALFKLFLRA